eukprot:COSAG05_NODE_30_length_28869_cov_54.944421_5_plen_156_part_00
MSSTGTNSTFLAPAGGGTGGGAGTGAGGGGSGGGGVLPAFSPEATTVERGRGACGTLDFRKHMACFELSVQPTHAGNASHAVQQVLILRAGSENDASRLSPPSPIPGSGRAQQLLFLLPPPPASSAATAPWAHCAAIKIDCRKCGIRRLREAPAG